MNTQPSKTMTADQAREWMNDHWDADEIGTDLDCDILDEAFEAVFGRRPTCKDNVFTSLKNHFQNH